MAVVFEDKREEVFKDVPARAELAAMALVSHRFDDDNSKGATLDVERPEEQRHSNVPEVHDHHAAKLILRRGYKLANVDSRVRMTLLLSLDGRIDECYGRKRHQTIERAQHRHEQAYSPVRSSQP